MMGAKTAAYSLGHVDGDAPCLVARQQISGGSATGLVPIRTDMRAPARCDRER